MYENIYTEFTTKLLPQIQQGLTITKDYFLDLFARYIKYLIVTDSISLLMSILLLGALVFGLRYSIKKYKDDDMWMLAIIITGIGVIIMTFGVYMDANNLVKDIYIPEVRIMEEINSYRK